MYILRITPLKQVKLHGCETGRRAKSMKSLYELCHFLWIEHRPLTSLEFCTCKQFTTQVVKYVFVKELAPDRAYFCQS